MTKTWVALYDIHYPRTDKPTLAAILDFLSKNSVEGVILGGDQLDNDNISHHTKGKPLYRERASYKRDTEGFDRDVLKPIEKLVGKAEKVWIIGNHDRFEHDLIEEQPELEGIIERPEALKLEARGWEIIPLGHAYRLGKLSVIHGEILTGVGNQAGMYPSKKAVELYADNVLAGHTHAPQSYTRVSPVSHRDKWQGWIAPIVGNTNPHYLRNRPVAWVNGMVIIEMFPSGRFNLYPVNIFDGVFAYGGKTYQGRK